MVTSESSNGREARRRRIVERGADRLALITGRIQTLPPESHLFEPSPSLPSDVPQASEDDKASSFENSHHDSPAESDKIGTSEAASMLPKLETSREVLKDFDKEEDILVPSSCAPLISHENDLTELRLRHGKIFTPKQINSAIAATENTRIYFSLAVAIVVALSYAGFPILGNTIVKNIIHYRPLYLVLITDISIVLKKLVLEGRHVQRSEREINEVPSVGGYGPAEQLGRALGLGLCFKNITNAMFMDFSIYAIVLVCALAVAQKLGL